MPMRASLAQAADELGPLYILVNNAGIQKRADFLATAEAGCDRMMDVNLKAAFFLAQSFAAHCNVVGRGGKVISISSRLGITVRNIASGSDGGLLWNYPEH